MECKNNISGIKEVFISEFNELPKFFFLQDEIVFSGNNKIVPIQLSGVSASQSFKDSVWTQKLTFKVPKLENNTNIPLYERNVYRAVIRDYKDQFWVLGANNGLVVNGINSDAGTNKQDFSGYDVDFEGKELNTFTQIYNIDGFIENAILFLANSNTLITSSKLITDKYE